VFNHDQQPATSDAIPVLTGLKGASRRSAPSGCGPWPRLRAGMTWRLSPASPKRSGGWHRRTRTGAVWTAQIWPVGP